MGKISTWSGVVACALWAGIALADDAEVAGAPALQVKGLIDARLVVTGDTVGWQSRGLGKARYGAATEGDGRVLARIAEVSAVATAQLTWDLSAVAHLIAAPEQKNDIDVAEAFLAYKPAPTSQFGISGRAGAFFPPVSLENSGLAWTSPFTISSSAINSRVGEELRVFGAEATAFRRGEDLDLSLLGAVYYANDPAGTILSWRGWAIHDRKAAIFDEIPLAPVRIIRPGASLDEQVPHVAPLAEIDDRAGYYVAARAEHHDLGMVEAIYYDNSADDREIQGGQWAWTTRFAAAGIKTRLPGQIDLIAQVMDGTTTVITIPQPVGPIVKAAFDSQFVLLSRDFAGHRLSLRWDRFATKDRDRFPDNNTENGHAWTLAYVVYPAEKQRLTVELLHIDSTRPERSLSFGRPAAWRETQIQASYRFFF
ncbi:MAG: hypothetical protein SFV21_06015 [Rhodospirillaceae bacterium]|nr:hypothetical protein [Rhodospirillaceae bacterium]